MRAVAIVLLSLSIVGVAACGDDGSKATRPDGATEITIDAPGGELDAVEMAEGSVGVVLAHGASTTKELWYPLMPALADAGMHPVAFDFGSDRAGDVRAAMSYLQDAGAEKIVLIGSSLGGANVLDVASARSRRGDRHLLGG